MANCLKLGILFFKDFAMFNQIVVETKFNAPVAQVFDLLSQHATYNIAFAPIQVDRVVDAPDAQRPDGLGSIRRMGFGSFKPLQEQITSFKENQLIEYKLINNPLIKHHIGRIAFSKISDTQTLVTYTIELQSKIPGLAAVILAQLKFAIRMGFSKLNKSHFG